MGSLWQLTEAGQWVSVATFRVQGDVKERYSSAERGPMASTMGRRTWRRWWSIAWTFWHSRRLVRGKKTNFVGRAPCSPRQCRQMRRMVGRSKRRASQLEDVPKGNGPPECKSQPLVHPHRDDVMLWPFLQLVSPADLSIYTFGEFVHIYNYKSERDHPSVSRRRRGRPDDTRRVQNLAHPLGPSSPHSYPRSTPSAWAASRPPCRVGSLRSPFRLTRARTHNERGWRYP